MIKSLGPRLRAACVALAATSAPLSLWAAEEATPLLDALSAEPSEVADTRDADETGADAGAEQGSAQSLDTPPEAHADEILPTIPVAHPEIEELPASEPGTAQLEDVVVTATKRPKSLRDIPASITEFDGRDLEVKGILSVNELLDKTPGVTANSARPGDQRVIMRGISTTAGVIATAPFPVGIFIGDTAFNEPYAASITPDLSAFDLQGIEVLKGPQGTLFGGAALSGAIRYRLNDPVPYVWQLRGFSQYTGLTEGGATFTHGVAANVPIDAGQGGAALRLAYIKRRYPGAYDNIRPEDAAHDVDEGKGEQFRIGALWEPMADWRVKFTYLEQDYQADNALVVANERNGPRESSISLLPWPNEHRFALYNLEIEHEFDSMKLVSSTSRTEKDRYNILDATGLLIGIPPAGMPDSLAVPFITEQDSTSFAQELRLQSLESDGLEWLAGAYYYSAPINYFLEVNVQALRQAGQAGGGLGTLLGGLIDGATNLLGPNNPLSTLLGALSPDPDQIHCELALLCAETRAKAREIALFFDVTDTFWEKLELSLGARGYQTDVSGGFIGRGLLARAVNNGMSPADVRSSNQERGINPKASATFRFTKAASIYALASRGFRFGGIQNIPPDETQNVPETFKSDSLWNYELGLRTAWFGNTMHFDVTGFHIDYKDPQVQLTTLEQLSYYDNIDSAVSDGVEGSFEWITPIPGIAISLVGGVVDAHTTADFMAGRTLVPAGAPLPGSARKQYRGQLAYFWPYGGDIEFGAAVTYAYIGRTQAGLPALIEVNDYHTVGANLHLGAPNWPGRPTLSIGVDNLTDVTAPVSPVKAATGDIYYILNTPRTFVARIGLEFD